MPQGTNAGNGYYIDPNWDPATLAYRAEYMVQAGYPPLQPELSATDALVKALPGSGSIGTIDGGNASSQPISIIDGGNA